jgi:hypothetical protein
MDDEAAVAEESSHTFLERDVRVGECSHVSCAICLAIFTAQVADLAGFWPGGITWNVFAADERIEMSESRIAVSIGGNRSYVNVEA